MAVVSASRSKLTQKSTYEEAASRGQANPDDIYWRESHDYSFALTQLAPTGAKIEAKTTLSSFFSSIDDYALDKGLDTNRPLGAKNHRGLVSLTLTQPLMRDAGYAVTNARRRVAEIDGRAAMASGRETEASVVAEGMMGYYDLILAAEKERAALGRVQMAERLLKEAEQLSRGGRLSQAEVWEVQSALDRYRSSHSEMKQARIDRGNRMLTMVMRSSEGLAGGLRPTDALPSDAKPVDADLEALVKIAKDRRYDLSRSKAQLEREGVQLIFAENQTLPRVDLVASYGTNGLEYDPKRALSLPNTKDYPTWSVGLQVTVPIGNRLARSDLAAADVRQRDAALNLRAMEIAITNEVDTSLRFRQSALERWLAWRTAAEREARALEIERAKFAAGRSDIREVLLREERALNARISALEQQTAYAKAGVLLEVAQGILLDRFPKAD
jgi:outer membrane protein TolC